jgi:hypothetical protein
MKILKITACCLLVLGLKAVSQTSGFHPIDTPCSFLVFEKGGDKITNSIPLILTSAGIVTNLANGDWKVFDCNGNLIGDYNATIGRWTDAK